MFARGGHGRKELVPGSDLDLTLLILHGNPQLEGALKDFVRRIWDAGWHPEALTFTPDNLTDSVKSDFDGLTSLLDSRLLWGDAEAGAILNRLLHDLLEGDLSHRLQIHHLNHFAKKARGYPAENERTPDLKTGIGGLRDLQVIHWLNRSSGGSGENNKPGIDLDWAYRKGWLKRSEASRLKALYDFQTAVRHTLKNLNGERGERVEEELREPLAARMDYTKGTPDISDQNLLQELTLARRQIALYAESLASLFAEPESASKRLLSNKSPWTLLQAENEELTRLSPFDLVLIHRFAKQSRSNPGQRTLRQWKERLESRKALYPLLILLHRTELLDRLLPEIIPLKGLILKDVYHAYPVDAHLLKSIEAVEKLGSEPPHPVWNQILAETSITALRCSVLLHDIGKGDEENHSVRGARMVRHILERWGLPELVEDISLIVKHHLLMEQFAFRRKLDDPATLAAFCSVISTPERLRLLLLVTYADLNAVRRGVYTRWKESLLLQLYWNSLKYLDSGEVEVSRAVPDSAHTVARLCEMPQKEIELHLRQLDTEYATFFSAEEMAAHLEAARRLESGNLPAQVEARQGRVSIVSRDAPGRLSLICAALTAADFNIIGARIFTRQDGMLFDVFDVDFTDKGRSYEESVRIFRRTLNHLLTGREKAESILQSHEHRIRRRQSIRSEVRPEVRLDDELSPFYTIVDVTGADSPGLLYRLTSVLNQSGLDIHAARITTREDGVIDSFYVREVGGGKVLDADRRTTLRQKLLAAVTRHPTRTKT